MTDDTSEQMTTETIQLTQVVLGLEPYTLIRAKDHSDGSGDLALVVEAGGGAEDQPLYMPLLALTEAPTEGNPVYELLVKLADDDTAAWDVATLREVARQFNDEWVF